MTEIRYNNYHRHTHYSNIRTPDVIVKPQDYIDRAKELGHTTYFTTEHGCSGNVFEAYDLCAKNDLKCIFGMEMYYADDRHVKEGRKNYHIVVIGLTKNAYKHINRISSEANKTGFYYHPRIDMELLLTLPAKEVVIATACIGGRLFKSEDYVNEFVLPLKNHFGDNFMLETQAHKHSAQGEWNRKVLLLSEEYNIPIIHGNDSHYIYPEDAELRSLFLKGKGMRYGDEDSFILDYPTYDVIVDRYKEQGILNDKQIEESLHNTLIFDKAEDLKFNKEIKMPTIYKEKNKANVLKKIIAQKWKEESKNIPKERHSEYEREIMFEMDIVEDTNMSDYFLLNERIIDKAVNVYNAVLTRTGRGSSPSFYINKLLGFTDIDRIAAPVPLYSTRFMSKSRILETGSLPDIDFNFSDVTPAIRASKDLLGEDGVYYMIAYGTMQESGAFRNLCRAHKDDLEHSKEKNEDGVVINNDFNKKIDEEIKMFNLQYNDVAKDLDSYRDDENWKDMIETSKNFIGVIDSVAPSPCSFLLLNEPISEEIGLIKVGDEMCCSIDGYTADKWKFLKNDLLTVGVWTIISKTFDMIKKPIPTIEELNELIDYKVWDLYANGITSTMNQVDSDFATGLVKKYKPTSIAELSAFVAAIRPGFSSLLNHFLNREEYSTGVDELDEVLQDSFHYLLYQESIMQFLVWCGIHEDETYGILKQIAKKHFEDDDLAILKEKLIEGFENNTGSTDGFDGVWQVIEDAVDYAFNASHSLSVAYDSLYGAYLKANYPLEYYTVVFNHYKNDIERTNKLVEELPYFGITLNPIKFGYSGAEYRYDRDTNSIYKGVESIKYLNEEVSNDLLELGKDKIYNNLYTLFDDIHSKTGINSRQLDILIKLNYFDKYGKNKKILDFKGIFKEIYGKKQFSKAKVDKLNLSHSVFAKHSRQTNKTYMEIDVENILKDLLLGIEDLPLSLKDQISTEIEYLNHIEFIEPRASEDYYVVTDFRTFKNKNRPYVLLYQLKTGKTKKTKVTDAKFYATNKFKLLDTIQIQEFDKQFKNVMVNNKWTKSDEVEEVLTSWNVF